MSIYARLRQCLEEEQLVAVATVIGGPWLGCKLLILPDGSSEGDLGSEALNRCLLDHAGEAFDSRTTGPLSVEPGDSGDPVDVFLEVHAPPDKLIIVGAVHIAIPLATFANELGFRTIVVDARSAFATAERFGHVDELIVRWPADALAEMHLTESTYIAFLSHDPKLDNPALQVALDSAAPYIGALGSKKTHAKRVDALRELGLTDEALSRIRAPIGLDLGGRRPEEIAVAIAAEVVAARHGRIVREGS